MPKKASPHKELHSAVDWRHLSGSTGIDCIEIWGAPCAAVSCATSGTLYVERVDGTTGSIDLRGYGNFLIPLQVNAVLTGSGQPDGVIVWQNHVRK